MQADFLKKVFFALSEEKLGSYRTDHSTTSEIILARYLYNAALCEALYLPLQIAEISLRNAVHRELTATSGTENWFLNHKQLTPRQTQKVAEAHRDLCDSKGDYTHGDMVSRLSFGFWTGFFQRNYPPSLKLACYLMPKVFVHAPKHELDLSSISCQWTKIKALRNRVFHHERIAHWKDLDAQHANILRLIGWISPELRDMALILDRFQYVHQNAMAPWVEKVRCLGQNEKK